jgi:anti-anti-sigma factor
MLRTSPGTLSHLKIDRRVEPGLVTLALSGEADLGSAPALDGALHEAEAPARRIVLDLGDLSFIDSSGLQVVIEAQQRASENGHHLVLTRVPAHADRLFRLTGVTDRLTIE